MPKKFTLPKSVRVGGVDIKIIFAATEDYGGFNPDKKLITLNEKIKEDKDLVMSTLFHEMVHAALFVSGQDEILQHEEGLVRCLEHILLPSWSSVLAKIN